MKKSILYIIPVFSLLFLAGCGNVTGNGNNADTNGNGNANGQNVNVTENTGNGNGNGKGSANGNGDGTGEGLGNPVDRTTAEDGSYTMAQVEEANIEDNCLSVIDGTVYNLTNYINKHPGGSDKILDICGKDGSSMFEGQHGGDRKIENMLKGFEIGTLQE